MRYIKNGTLKSILLIIIGATILSFGSYNFNYQNNVTEGGVLGLLLLLQHVFNISPSITSVVIDFSLFTIGSKFFGKKFLLYSILNAITRKNVLHASGFIYTGADSLHHGTAQAFFFQHTHRLDGGPCRRAYHVF